MKKTMFFLVTSLLTAIASHADPTVNSGPAVSMPVAGVYAPVLGFDDNDHVMLVIDGVLPNACYTRGASEVNVNLETKTLTVVQYAARNYAGPCSDESQLPDQLKVPVRFMSEVSVGQLDAGDYTVYFDTNEGHQARPLNVAVAPNLQIDNLKYANTTSAFVYEVVSANEKNMKIILTGYLNSSCAELDDKVLVSRQEDVIILLPQVKVTLSYCLPAVKDFVKEVVIPTPDAGRYLLHVRSMNGSAVNRLFTVK